MGRTEGYMIKNKVALVTGVSSGIGQETAQILAERAWAIGGSGWDFGWGARRQGVGRGDSSRARTWR
jgi:NAD(P)-dependent dehydrogenase (short-subunit alcohol dehydrogenase family)